MISQNSVHHSAVRLHRLVTKILFGIFRAILKRKQNDTYDSISDTYFVKNLPRFLRSHEPLPLNKRPALVSFSSTSLASSPMYIPDIIFSKSCLPGLIELVSMSVSNSVMTKSRVSCSPNAPHSVFISMCGFVAACWPGIAHLTFSVFST